MNNINSNKKYKKIVFIKKVVLIIFFCIINLLINLTNAKSSTNTTLDTSCPGEGPLEYNFAEFLTKLVPYLPYIVFISITLLIIVIALQCTHRQKRTLTEIVPEKKEKRKCFCYSCGAQLKEKASFCEQCGVKVRENKN